MFGTAKPVDDIGCPPGGPTMPSRRATQTLAWCAAGSAPRALLRRTMAADRLLTVVGLLTLLTLALMLLGVAFDRRAISGVPAWIKPAKFAISISIYSFSLLLLLSLVQGHAVWLR